MCFYKLPTPGLPGAPERYLLSEKWGLPAAATTAAAASSTTTAKSATNCSGAAKLAGPSACFESFINRPQRKRDQKKALKEPFPTLGSS